MNTRDHYVPQFYLRKWAREGDKIWAYPIGGEPPFQSSVVNLACETGLYSQPPGNRQTPCDTEDALAGLEGEMAAVWPEIILHCEPPAMRKQMARWIALMHFRNPVFRENVRGIHELLQRAARQVVDMGHPPNSKITLNFGGAPLEMTVNELNKRASTDEDAVTASFITLLRSHGEKLACLLMTRRWGIIIAKEPAFVTTDNPVLLVRGTATSTDFGFGTRGSEVFFPITPKWLLIISDEWEHEFSYGELANPDVFNEIVVSGAERFVFGWTKDEELRQKIVGWRGRS
jgi:hypothetical protein